jgi:hypothetical protein
VDGMEIALRRETAAAIRMRPIKADVKKAELLKMVADEKVPDLHEVAR